jgi:small subunit ribosomal protein S3
MGQKVNPIGLRLGINRTWDSRWFANTGEYGQLLHEDLKIRKYLEKELKQAAISKVVIERPHKKCRVTIHAARPGLIIGKKGADIEKLRKKLTEMTKSETHLNIVEVRKPEIDATLIAQSIAQQLDSFLGSPLQPEGTDCRRIVALSSRAPRRSPESNRPLDMSTGSGRPHDWTSASR